MSSHTIFDYIHNATSDGLPLLAGVWYLGLHIGTVEDVVTHIGRGSLLPGASFGRKERKVSIKIMQIILFIYKYIYEKLIR